MTDNKNHKLHRCLLWLCVSLVSQLAAQKPTAILGAMPEEIAALKEAIRDSSSKTIGGINFLSGRINNRKVVVVQSGIGKVNAAMTCTLLVENFQPARVLFTGVAGGVGPTLNVGDIVIADSAVQHDYGVLTDSNAIRYRGTVNPLDGSRNPVYFPCDTILIHAALQQGGHLSLQPLRINNSMRTPVIRHGIVATGDVFVSSGQKKSELQKNLRADAVEMEGAAVAQICYQRKVPFLIVRSISDLAGRDAGISFDAFKLVAAKNAAALVQAILSSLPEYPAEERFRKTEMNTP